MPVPSHGQSCVSHLVLKVVIFPLRIATADRFPSNTLSQHLGHYMRVSLDKFFLLTEHEGWEKSEDTG